MLVPRLHIDHVPTAEQNPKLDWSLVMVKLDFEGFLLSDENAFTLLMTIYKLCCEVS